MKIEIELNNMDINDKSQNDLILRGVNVGKYNEGLYNRWELKYIEKNNDVIADIENYVCGLIHDKLKIPVETAQDVIKADGIIRNTYNSSIINCFEDMLKGEMFLTHEN